MVRMFRVTNVHGPAPRRLTNLHICIDLKQGSVDWIRRCLDEYRARSVTVLRTPDEGWPALLSALKDAGITSLVVTMDDKPTDEYWWDPNEFFQYLGESGLDMRLTELKIVMADDRDDDMDLEDLDAESEEVILRMSRLRRLEIAAHTSVGFIRRMHQQMPSLESFGCWTIDNEPGDAPMPPIVPERTTALRRVQVAAVLGTATFDWMRNMPRGTRIELMPGGDSERARDDLESALAEAAPFMATVPVEHRAFYTSLRRRLQRRM